MGTAAAVEGDRIVGACPHHLVPDPLGLPIVTPVPLPFSAPLTRGLVPTVRIAGRAAAVQTSTGDNAPPHAGLHPSDPYFVPTTQTGTVVVGSPTVYAGGKPLARTGSAVTCCKVPGTLVGTATTVLVA